MMVELLLKNTWLQTVGQDDGGAVVEGHLVTIDFADDA